MFPQLAAYSLVATALIGALALHVVPALLTGLLAFALTRRTLHRLRGLALPAWCTNHELLAGGLIGTASLLLVAGLGAGVASLLAGESLQGLLLTLAETLEQSKRFLPPPVAAQLPGSVLEVKDWLAHSLKTHAAQVAGVSTHAIHALVLMVIGWLVGVLAAIRPVPTAAQPLFAAAWQRLWHQVVLAFERVAFAQIKIAALNAALTAVFLLIICPLVGWKIPYAKTLVLATFLCGLLPVIGNLVSNALIGLLALGVSLSAAVAALAFLVVIHKLEYFVAARFQGDEIGARSWELLIMLFAFETLFGPAGMVAAPIFYAFVKDELRRHAWLSA